MKHLESLLIGFFAGATVCAVFFIAFPLITHNTPEPDITLSDINETLSALYDEVLELHTLQWETQVLLTGLHEIAPPPEPDTIYVTLPNPQPWPKAGAPYHGITTPIEDYALIQGGKS